VELAGVCVGLTAVGIVSAVVAGLGVDVAAPTVGLATTLVGLQLAARAQTNAAPAPAQMRVESTNEVR
jgi:hypothetical protein